MGETITVTYERNLSDGDGGSERLSIGLTLALMDDELAEECLNDGTVHGLVERVRAAVLRELARSKSKHVAAVAAGELDRAEDSHASSAQVTDLRRATAP
jgi:hypothetical protein